MKMRTRPAAGVSDFIHVAVPCRPMDNAARCVQPGVWVKKILPEIKRAKHITSEVPEGRRSDYDYVVGMLLGSTVTPRNFLPDDVIVNPVHTYINADSITSSSDSMSDEEDDEEVEEIEKPESSKNDIIDLDDFVPVSVSSNSSTDSEGFLAEEGNGRPNVRVDPRIQAAANKTKGGPIVIHDCPECNYFAFSKSDLDTHHYAIHEFPKKNVGNVQKEEDKFRILPKFKKQIGYQVFRPRNMQWTAESARYNRYK